MSSTPQTVPAWLELARQRLGSKTIQRDRQGDVSLETMLARAARAAEGLRKHGVKPGDRVGLLADNSRDWIVADLAIQLTRAASVPRGTDTPVDEVAYLLQHARAGVVLAHDAGRAVELESIRPRVPTMGEIICIDGQDAPGATLEDLVTAGEGAPSFGEQAAAVRPDDVATIIYTSGTTGRPKGVVLTQSNFSHQVEVVPPLFTMGPKETFLSILPPWHSFERTVEYAALASGGCIAYTDRRRFKEDLRRYQPTFVPSVPRLWETVYDGVRKALEQGGPVKRALFKGGYAVASARAWGWDRLRNHLLRIRKPRGLGWVPEILVRGFAGLTALVTLPFDRLAHLVVFRKVKDATGGRLRGAISGGGLMPEHIDTFFRVIGVPICVGYGLTETSPVVACRREERNVLGTIGTAIPQVEIQIRDAETGKVLPAGHVGLVFTRGPNLMQGYYEAPELTREVIDENGWFNTGDLGLLTEYGDLCFRGRAKETIVLAGGENVEPTHVESAILASPLVEQVFVAGQDRKTLAALVLPAREAITKAAGLDSATPLADLAVHEEVRKLLHRAVVKATAVLAPYERVTRVAVLPAALDVADGTLTQTLKLRRHVIVERYRALIEEAYGA